jgi:hypothetical protein
VAEPLFCTSSFSACPRCGNGYYPPPRPGRYKCPQCDGLLQLRQPRAQRLPASLSAIIGGVFTLVAVGLLLTHAPRFAERVAAAPGRIDTPVPSVGYLGPLYQGRPGHEGREAHAFLLRATQLERDLRLDTDDFDIATRMAHACLSVAERDIIVGPAGAERALRKAAWALAAARRDADPDTDGPYLAMLESRWRLMANPGSAVRAPAWGYSGYGGYGPPPGMGSRDIREAREEIARLQARAAASPERARHWRRVGRAYVALARAYSGAREQPFGAERPMRSPAAREALAAAEDALSQALQRARSPEGRRLAYTSLARVYHLQGRNDAERAALERAVRLRPNLRRDWERLADACGQAGDFAAARRALTAAERCEPGPF